VPPARFADDFFLLNGDSAAGTTPADPGALEATFLQNPDAGDAS